MSIYDKYSLIDPLPGEGIRGFRGRQLSTGRDVTVHLLLGGSTPETTALLARLHALPEQQLPRLVEIGDHEGTTFVVTVAPPFQHLGEWLDAQEREAAEARALKNARVGIWKVPVSPQNPPAPVEAATPFTIPPAVPMAAPVPPLQPLSATPAGEFTRMFQAPPSAPTPPAAMPAPAAAASPDAAPPGEFTRMFQAPPVAPAAEAPAPPSPAPAAAAPGEFTRMFQSPAPTASPESPGVTPTPPQPPSGPGEFTRAFNSPLVERPVKQDWPASPPKPADPGEFTRFFRAPSSAAPPGPPLPTPSGFPPAESPFAPPPAPPAPSQPGEFTRMFGTPGVHSQAPAAPPPASPPQQPVPPAYSGGGATQVFSPPRAPALDVPRAPQGPSEYTQMISSPQSYNLTPRTPAAPATPQMPAVSIQPVMPAAPVQPAVPPVSFQPAVPARAPAANTLLIAIFCLLAFLAGGLVMLFLLKR